MEEQSDQVVSLPTPAGAAEERMLRADLVREMVARAQRGEGAKRIARELGVDRKTVKRWLRLGAWQPRRHQRRPRPIDGFVKFIEQRGPEVGWVPAAAARGYRDCHGRSKPPLSFLIYLQAFEPVYTKTCRSYHRPTLPQGFGSWRSTFYSATSPTKVARLSRSVLSASRRPIRR
jgi:Helix-turn-helix domain